jgi:AcrR family transcriptional regulator
MSTRRHARLTRRSVLEAALALVDREGAGALTMRRLGDELGVAAMSLYNHVAGRGALLDGLSEVMVGELDVGADGQEPVDVLRRFARGIRSVALAHPHAFELVGMRPLSTRASLEPVDTVLGSLRALGIEGPQAVYAYRALTSYARGFALAEIAGFTLESAAEDEAEAVAALPHVAALAPHLQRRSPDAAFEFGLDALLAGVDFAPRKDQPPGGPPRKAAETSR